MQPTPKRPRLFAAVAVAAALWPVLATGQLRGEPPAGDAEQPAVNDAERAAPLAEGPNYEKYAEGLYARLVYRTDHQAGGYAVEVWALLIGPGKKTEGFTLPGNAALLVRLGRAVIAAGDAKREFGLGASLLVPEGRKVSIVNVDPERPVSIRAVIIKGLE
jgi:hypothetical protein